MGQLQARKRCNLREVLLRTLIYRRLFTNHLPLPLPQPPQPRTGKLKSPTRSLCRIIIRHLLPESLEHMPFFAR